MEPSKYKHKDELTQKILDDIYRNGLGSPIIMDNAPTTSQVKTNTLVFHGTDLYIKKPDGTLIKITGTSV